MPAHSGDISETALFGKAMTEPSRKSNFKPFRNSEKDKKDPRGLEETRKASWRR